MSPMNQEIERQLDIVADEIEDIFATVYDGVQLPADIMKGVAEGLEASQEYQKLIEMLAPGQMKWVLVHISLRIPQFVLNALVPLTEALSLPE